MQDNRSMVSPGSGNAVQGAHHPALSHPGSTEGVAAGAGSGVAPNGQGAFSASMSIRQPETVRWPVGEAVAPIGLGNAVSWQVRQPTYNLFRHRRKNDICCAVPEDRPVPAFLRDEAWFYAGALPGHSHPPMGFDHSAAELGVRLNGFHLFQVVCRKAFAVQRQPGLR